MPSIDSPSRGNSAVLTMLVVLMGGMSAFASAQDSGQANGLSSGPANGLAASDNIVAPADCSTGTCSRPEAEGGVPSQRRWYAMLCMANAYPGLKSEEVITHVLDPALGTVAPGIENIHTFTQMRDHGLLWVPNIGVGYNLSEKLSVFLQLGYGRGPVRTKDSAPSLILLPLDLYFEMQRSALTITPGLDWFPFGMVKQRDYHGLADRLRAIRPMFGVRVPWTHAGYKAHAKLGLGFLDPLVDVHLGDYWDLWSVNVNVGFDVPLDRRDQLNVNIGRSRFFSQNSDFGGTVFSVTWKHLF